MAIDLNQADLTPSVVVVGHTSCIWHPSRISATCTRAHHHNCVELLVPKVWNPPPSPSHVTFDHLLCAETRQACLLHLLTVAGMQQIMYQETSSSKRERNAVEYRHTGTNREDENNTIRADQQQEQLVGRMAGWWHLQATDGKELHMKIETMIRKTTRIAIDHFSRPLLLLL